jgi:hypothetical protein
MAILVGCKVSSKLVAIQADRFQMPELLNCRGGARWRHAPSTGTLLNMGVALLARYRLSVDFNKINPGGTGRTVTVVV